MKESKILSLQETGIVTRKERKNEDIYRYGHNAKKKWTLDV